MVMLKIDSQPQTPISLNEKILKPDSKPIHSVSLTKDQFGIYHLPTLSLKKPHKQVFYGDGKKIAETSYASGKIAAIFYTKKQVNIDAKITCRTLDIQSVGPVILTGNISVGSDATFSGQAFGFKGEVKVGGMFDLTSVYASEFLNMTDVSCLDIRAPSIINRVFFTIHSKGKINVIKLKNTGVFRANKLKLKADSLKNTGKLMCNSSDAQVNTFKNDSKASFSTTTLMVAHNVTVSESAHLIFKKSTVSVPNANFSCHVNVEKSTITSERNLCFDGPTEIKQSALIAADKINTTIGATVEESNLQAPHCFITNIATLSGTVVQAAEVALSTQPGAVVKRCEISAPMIKIENPRQQSALTLVAVLLTTDSYQHRGNVVFSHNTQLVPTPKSTTKPSCNVYGCLTLIYSHILMENGRLRFNTSAKLSLNQKSSIQCQTLHLHGDAHLSRSAISTQHYLQTNGTITANQSLLLAKESVRTEKTYMRFSKKSKLLAATLSVDGKLQADQSEIRAESTFTFTDSSVCLNKSVAQFGDTAFSGIFQSKGSSVKTENLKAFAKFELTDQSQFEVAGDFIGASKEAYVCLEKSRINTTQTLDSFGTITLEDSQAQVSSLKTRTSTSTTLTASQVTGKKLVHRGALHIKKQTTPSLVLTESIETGPKSLITAPSLQLDVERFNHKGKLKVEKDLSLKGKYFTQTGEISAKKSIHLGFDRTIINMGLLSAKSVSMQAPFLLHLTGSCSSVSYSAQGLVNLNIGSWVRANNIYNAGLISYNGGLHTPNLVNPKHLFTFRNLWTASRMMAISLAPQYTSAISLVSMAPGLYSTGQSLYRHTRDLDKKGLSGMRAHEWVEAACSLNTATTLGYNIYSTSQSDFNMGTDDGELAPVWDIKWGNFAKGATLALIGSNTEDALININTGVSTSVNTMRTGVFSINTGVDVAANTYSVNTHYGCNYGIQQGAKFSYTANTLANHGLQEGIDSYRLYVDKLTDSENAIARGNHVDVNINDFQQKGHFKMSNGNVKISDHGIRASADPSFINSQVSGQTTQVNGQLSTNNCQYDYTDQLINENGSTSHVGSHVSGAELDNHGKSSYDNSTVDIETRTEHRSGEYTANQSSFNHDKFVEGGHSTTDQVYISATEYERTQVATADNTDTTINATTLTDAAASCNSGQVSYQATNYQHTGHFSSKSEEGAVILITADEATLAGSSDLKENDHLALQSDQFEDAAAFALGNGKYDAYSVAGGAVSVETKCHVDIKSGNQRKADITISAATIDINHRLQNADHTTALQTSEGDINVKEGVDAGVVFVDSAGDLNVSDHLHSKDLTDIHTGGVVRNLSGIIDSEKVTLIDAQEVLVIDKNADPRAEPAEIDAGIHDDKSSDHLLHRPVISPDSETMHHEDTNPRTEHGEVEAGTHDDKSSDHLLHRPVISPDSEAMHNEDTNPRTEHGEVGAGILDDKSSDHLLHRPAISLDSEAMCQENTDPRREYDGLELGIMDAKIRGGELLYIKTTKGESGDGSLEMQGGTLEGNTIIGDIAGDLELHGRESTYQGEHDIRTEYTAAEIAAGDGSGNNGFAVAIQAQGKGTLDLVAINSDGNNYIGAEQGLEGTGRSNLYVSKSEEKKSGIFHNHKTSITESSYDYADSSMKTTNGKNYFDGGAGEANSIGMNYESTQGGVINGNAGVALKSYVYETQRIEKDSRGCGIIKHDNRDTTQWADPTVIDSPEGEMEIITQNVADLSGVDVHGHDLNITAKTVIFGRDILDHKSSQHTTDISVTTNLDAIIDVISHGGQGASGLDPAAQKIDALLIAQGGTELGAAALNMGIEAVNSAGTIAHAIGEDAITEDALGRYGLGGEDGFVPSVTATYTRQHTETEFQTLAENEGIALTGNLRITASEEIQLNDGVQVSVAGDAQIAAPRVTSDGAELQYSQTTSEQSISIGVDISGNYSGGVSASNSHTQGTINVNSALNIGGHADLTGVQDLQLTNGNMTAASGSANLNSLIIETRQDTMQTQSSSVGFNTSGAINASKQKSEDRVTGERSGIHFTDGINESDENQFTAHTAELTGAAITTDGVNNFTAGSTIVTDLLDTHHQSGIAISTTVGDLSRVLPGSSAPTNKTGERTIGTATVSLTHEDKCTDIKTVVHGATKTDINPGMLTGSLHTEDTDGRIIVRDDSMHLTLDVPLTNRDHLKNMQQNITAASEKLSEPKPEAAELDPNTTHVTDGVKPEDNTDAKPDQPLNDEVQQLFEESPELKSEMLELATLMGEEFSTSDALSTETQLRVDEVLNTLLKQGISEQNASIVNELMASNEPGSTGLGYAQSIKGTGVHAVFNLLLAEGDNIDEKLLNAGIATVGDIAFDALLGRIFTTAAGPVGWGVTAVAIADGITYDPDRNEQYFAESEIHTSNDRNPNLPCTENISEHVNAYIKQDAAVKSELIHAPFAAIGTVFDKVKDSIRPKAETPSSSVAQNPSSLFGKNSPNDDSSKDELRAGTKPKSQ